MTESIEMPKGQILQSVSVETARRIKDARKANKERNADQNALEFILSQFRSKKIPKPSTLAQFDDNYTHHILGMKPPISFSSTAKGFEFVVRHPHEPWNPEYDRAVVFVPEVADL